MFDAELNWALGDFLSNNLFYKNTFLHIFEKSYYWMIKMLEKSKIYRTTWKYCTENFTILNHGCPDRKLNSCLFRLPMC
jgi:hypothetical protein